MASGTTSGGPRTIAIAGASLAGLSAAETLRRDGFKGQIVLCGAENVHPYDRTLLSKSYLLEETPEERLLLRPPEFYAEHRIETRLGVRVTGLDIDARRLELESGEQIPFDAALLATGSRPRRLRLPGADLPGVLTLRSLDDARALRQALASAEAQSGRIGIIGAGFIGAEIASACRALALDVSVVEMLPVPLSRALGPEMGTLFAEIHREHGVDLRLGAEVAAIEGSARVEAIRLQDGSTIPCHTVVVGVGVTPETGWLEGSGIALDDGVPVDHFCETNVPGIFAAGDLARWPYTFPASDDTVSVRLEHWDNALRQGESAAHNMLGQHVPYRPTPYFWSDQYDLKIQMLGLAPTWETLVVRGDPATRSFLAFYLVDGRIWAGLLVNRPRDMVPLKRLIASGARLDVALLADDSMPLKSLAPNPSAR